MSLGHNIRNPKVKYSFKFCAFYLLQILKLYLMHTFQQKIIIFDSLTCAVRTQVNIFLIIKLSFTNDTRKKNKNN